MVEIRFWIVFEFYLSILSLPLLLQNLGSLVELIRTLDNLSQ